MARPDRREGAGSTSTKPTTATSRRVLHEAHAGLLPSRRPPMPKSSTPGLKPAERARETGAETVAGRLPAEIMIFAVGSLRARPPGAASSRASAMASSAEIGDAIELRLERAALGLLEGADRRVARHDDAVRRRRTIPSRRTSGSSVRSQVASRRARCGRKRHRDDGQPREARDRDRPRPARGAAGPRGPSGVRPTSQPVLDLAQDLAHAGRAAARRGAARLLDPELPQDADERLGVPVVAREHDDAADRDSSRASARTASARSRGCTGRDRGATPERLGPADLDAHGRVEHPDVDVRDRGATLKRSHWATGFIEARSVPT